MIKYQAKIIKDSGQFSVEFPDLPGCFSFGETLEEAKKMASEALSLYLEEARDPKWHVPEPKERKSKGYYWIQPKSEVGIPLMIRTSRLNAGYSQNQFAKILGISVQQLQKLETPGKSNPTIRTLAKISNVLKSNLEINVTPHT